MEESCLNCPLCEKLITGDYYCRLAKENMLNGKKRYCPKKPREVVEFVKKQDELIRFYKNIGTITKATHKTPKEKIRIEYSKNGLVVSYDKKSFVTTNANLVDLARLAGLFGEKYLELGKEVSDESEN